jgi:hypothetical protein
MRYKGELLLSIGGVVGSAAALVFPLLFDISRQSKGEVERAKGLDLIAKHIKADNCPLVNGFLDKGQLISNELRLSQCYGNGQVFAFVEIRNGQRTVKAVYTHKEVKNELSRHVSAKR